MVVLLYWANRTGEEKNSFHWECKLANLDSLLLDLLYFERHGSAIMILDGMRKKMRLVDYIKFVNGESYKCNILAHWKVLNWSCGAFIL